MSACANLSAWAPSDLTANGRGGEEWVWAKAPFGVGARLSRCTEARTPAAPDLLPLLLLRRVRRVRVPPHDRDICGGERLRGPPLSAGLEWMWSGLVVGAVSERAKAMRPLCCGEATGAKPTGRRRYLYIR